MPLIFLRHYSNHPLLRPFLLPCRRWMTKTTITTYDDVKITFLSCFILWAGCYYDFLTASILWKIPLKLLIKSFKFNRCIFYRFFVHLKNWPRYSLNLNMILEWFRDIVQIIKIVQNQLIPLKLKFCLLYSWIFNIYLLAQVFFFL